MDWEKAKVVLGWVFRIAFACVLIKLMWDVILVQHAFFS